MKIGNILLVLFCLVLNFQILKAQHSGFEKAGDILQIGIPAFAGTVSLFDSDQQYKATRDFIGVFGTSTLIMVSLKVNLDRSRPNGGRFAFPSGHTSSAFTGAAYIHYYMGWEFGIPAYALASYVAWSRVYANKHHVEDVIGGMALGIICGYLLPRLHQHEQVSLGLMQDNDAQGITLRYNF